MSGSKFYRVCEDVDWDMTDRCTWLGLFWSPLPARPRNVVHRVVKYISSPLVENQAKSYILWSYIYRLAQTGRAQDLIHLFDIECTSPPLTSIRLMYSLLFLLAYRSLFHLLKKLLPPTVHSYPQ